MVERKPIIELATVGAGQGAPQRNEDFTAEGTPFIRASSLERLLGGAMEQDLERITSETAEKYGLRVYPPGTVVFAKSGMSAKKDRVYRLREECHVVNHLCTLVPNENTDPDYLVHVLKAHPPSSLIKDDVYPSITQTQIERFKIPWFQPADQRRIAELLSRAEGLIAQRKESIQLIDGLVCSVFFEMFGNPVRNEKGWKTEPLGQLLDVLENGWSPVCEKDSRTSASEWAVLKLGAVSWQRFNATENKKLPPSEAPRELVEVQPGDLLLTRKNTRDLVGTAAYVFNTPRRLLLPDLIFRLEPKPNTVHKIFLCHVFNHPSMRPRVAKLSSGSASSMPNISMEKLRKLRVPVPDWDLQRKFGRMVEESEKLREGPMKESAEQLEQLYGSLSQRAFRGELVLGSTDPGPTSSTVRMDVPKGVHAHSQKGIGKHTVTELSMLVKQDVILEPKRGNTAVGTSAFEQVRQVIHSSDLANGPFSFKVLFDTVRAQGWSFSYEEAREVVFAALSGPKVFLRQVYGDPTLPDQDPDNRAVYLYYKGAG